MSEAMLPAVPAAVELDVRESDLDAMRADYLRHAHGVPRPWIGWIGVLNLVLSVAKVARHQNDWWFWAVAGVLFIFMSLRAGANVPSAERVTELHFSDTGLDADVAFAPNRLRHYAWRNIRAIHDTGEAFVLVPSFGKRLVFPKRAFPDGGREAGAFFAAHGVVGRRAAVQTIAVS
jgi:hypothetical protein